MSLLRPTDEHEDFGNYYSATLLRSDIAQGIFDLAYRRETDVHAAIDRVEAAVQLPDEQARSRTLSSIRLSALHLLHGDAHGGAAVGLRAIGAAPGIGSARIADSLWLLDQAAGSERARSIRGGGELRRGTGESVGEGVAEAVRVIRASGLPNETNALFTTIEGEWDEVMAVVKQAIDAVMAVAPRCGIVLKGISGPE